VDLDTAIAIFNDPRRVAYLEYTHNTMYRVVGEFEFGYDVTYDEIALALALIAVEVALSEDLYEFVPANSFQLGRGTGTSTN
jgi:hypothetical protein